MTFGELTEHTELLRGLLRTKERQLSQEPMSPAAHSDLALQINALIDRVNQLDQGLRSLVQRLPL
jgi:hypothetical protein